MAGDRNRRVEQVIALRKRGLTHREIAERLGISRSHVSSLIYDPTGEKDRARKASYAGSCEVCGRATSGSDGPRFAPKRCRSHARQRYWTRERIIEAIQRFAAEHGRPPRSNEWATKTRGDGYPALGSIYKSRSNPYGAFDSWADAIEAAGFPRPRTGHYERTPESRARLSRSLRAAFRAKREVQQEEISQAEIEVALSERERGKRRREQIQAAREFFASYKEPD